MVRVFKSAKRQLPIKCRVINEIGAKEKFGKVANKLASESALRPSAKLGRPPPVEVFGSCLR